MPTMPQSGLTANEINNEMYRTDRWFTASNYLFAPAGGSHPDPYEWWSWRKGGPWGERLRELFDTYPIPGPANIPVLASLEATTATALIAATGLTQAQDETAEAYIKRWLLETVVEQN